MKAAIERKLTNMYDAVEKMIKEVDEMKSDLENDFDEKSEKWQEGDKGEAMQELIEKLSDISDDLSSARQNLEDAKSMD